MADIREFKIVVSKNASYNERRAAVFISNNIKVAIGKRLPLITDDEAPSQYEIVIGKTAREDVFGMDFCRSRAGAKSFKIKYADGRLYITHLGTPLEYDTEEPPYDPATPMDNGDYGLMYAAYYFTDFILGYRCILPMLETLCDKGDIEIDERCNYDYTREFFSTQMPKKFKGAAMYFVPASGQPNITQCNIFKTKEGKLIVLDGGVPDNAEHLVSILEYLWEGEGKPVVSAWFLSHLHIDHYGAYVAINQKSELAERIRIENFYCDLMENDFYLGIGEGGQWSQNALDALLRNYDITGASVKRVVSGQKIVIDEMVFEVVHAPSEIKNEPKKPYLCCNINDTSVVYKLHYNNEQTVLLLTDAEGSCSINMLKNHREQLKCDIVQYGHHGGQSVSKECYAATGAKVAITPQGVHGWFCDGGEAPSQTDSGIRRSLSYMCEQGITPENIYCDMFGSLSFELPINIK